MTDLIEEKKSTDLVLKIESKIISANTSEWEEEQKAFLSGLTKKFETDEDFGKAQVELKQIEARENAAKIALKAVVDGSEDITSLVAVVEEMIEELAQARINHTKKLKEEKDRLKQREIDDAVAEICETYKIETPITNPLRIRMPIDTLIERITNSTKRKQGIKGVKAGINAEMASIKAELMTTITDLNSRLAQLPSDKMYLFEDANQLIAGDCDLQTIIDERTKAEADRIEREKADEKARIEAEIKNEAQEKAKTECAQQPVRVKEQSVAEPQQQVVEHVNDAYTVYVNNVTMHVYGNIDDVKEIAKCLKGNFETVRLVKGAQ